MPDRRTRWVNIAPILVATACLVTQLIVLVEQRSSDPTFYVPIVDAGDYHAAAVRFAGGDRLADDAFWQPPMFPFLLGCLYYVVGESILVAKLFLLLLGTGSGMLIWWIGSRLFSPRVGLIAGLMLSVYGPFLFFNSQLLPTGLAVFLNLVALALWLRCIQTPCWYRWLLLGLAIGAATITVPNSGVLLMVVIGVLALSRSPQQPRQAIAASFLLALGMAVPVGSVTLHNYMVSHEFVIISANGGINLYIGNNPDRDRTVAVRPGAAWKRLARQSHGDELPSRAEQNTYFLRRGLAYVVDEPFDFLAGLGKKAIRVVNAREIPRNVDPYVYRDFSGLLAILMWRAGPVALPFGLLAPLAALGVVVSLRQSPEEHAKRRGRYGLLAYVALYGASIIVFFVSGRYRIPVAVALIPFAAAGVDWFWRRLSSIGKDRDVPRDRHVGGPHHRRLAVAVCIIAVALVNLPILVPTHGVNFRAELLTAVGHTYGQRGELDRAEDYLREALNIDPLNTPAVCRLATVLAQRGAFEEAERLLRTVIQLDERAPEIHEVLAALQFHQNRLPAAETSYRKALTIDPTSPNAHAGLADVLAQTGNVEEAIAHYREALRFTSESGEILIHLAELLVNQASYGEAIEFYRRALWKIEPDPATLNSIAWLLATCPDVELRDCEQAIDLAEHLCDLTEYEQPVALDTLAAAYAECGQLDDALTWVRRAIDVALAQGDQTATASFRQRERMYQERLKTRLNPESPPSAQP